MKKTLVSYLVLISLVAPAIHFFSSPVTACGREPVTLLDLYKHSHSIHVATYRGTVEGKEQREKGESYGIIDQKKHFAIKRTLKGPALKTVALDDKRYVYDKPTGEGSGDGTDVLADETHAEIDHEEESEAVELKKGDEVLIFLSKDSETGKLALTEYVDGVKKLSREDLAIYTARIAELKPIFAAKKIDNEKILDWLVRLAEDRATRWDATYELRRSFSMLDYKREQLAAGEVPDPDESGEDYLGKTSAAYAEAMTEYHRQRLTAILMSSEFSSAKSGAAESKLAPGDSELISLVARWGTSRTAEVLREKLRHGLAAYESADLMREIAAILGDDELKDLSTSFGEIAYYSDTDVVEETEAQGERDANAAADPTEATAVKKAPETYKQRRDSIMSRFLARADQLLAAAEAR